MAPPPDQAAYAGASFVVSPTTDAAVIGRAVHHGLVALPGAMTPTEIAAAISAGAPAVKVFPARNLGPAFVRDVLAPMPHARLVPVGGVALDDVAPYLAAGALAVGVGSPLIGDALDDGDLTALATRARDYVAAATQARTR